MENSAGNFSLFSIADVSGNCLTTGISKIDLLFGQNVIYSCLSPNPCANSLYIDQLAK